MSLLFIVYSWIFSGQTSYVCPFSLLSFVLLGGLFIIIFWVPDSPKDRCLQLALLPPSLSRFFLPKILICIKKHAARTSLNTYCTGNLPWSHLSVPAIITFLCPFSKKKSLSRAVYDFCLHASFHGLLTVFQLAVSSYHSNKTHFLRPSIVPYHQNQ